MQHEHQCRTNVIVVDHQDRRRTPAARLQETAAPLRSVTAKNLSAVNRVDAGTLTVFCTADIEYAVKNSFVWHAGSMTQMWPEYRPLPKPWWHSHEDWEELKPELPEPWKGVPIADGVELEQPSIH